MAAKNNNANEQKNPFRFLKDPLKVIKEGPSEFAIWFLFTIITGQIGIIANIIIRYYGNQTPITDSLALDSNNGSFYTFAIALVASTLGPLFINLSMLKVIQFRLLKIYTIIISIFFLFFSGIVYAVVQSKNEIFINNDNIAINWTQAIVYFFAILVVCYGYCILRLENEPEKYNHLETSLYYEQDDQKVNNRIEEGKMLIDDGMGVEL